MEGLGDPAGSLVLLDRQWLLHLRDRIHTGPFTLAHGDGAELLAGGAVFVHVAAGGHRVARVRSHQAVVDAEAGEAGIRETADVGAGVSAATGGSWLGHRRVGKD